ncbi:hypothetical protein JQC91_03545 [Jannaschia sp. Os4]|uniref:response regulator receiver domain n=1 Tax=Jannaschia sp. Os4 TaxID=2807617 RepID=UPI00193A0FCD|nr:response regulator receiver domain [Jannaschia sp. Os4]MBM2575369.1 hypothetical protein [Jannaschia sp. Os4]
MTATYEELISEAFIDPIRSVLIVDDDYPTLREVLLPEEEQEKRHGHKSWRSETGKADVQAVIDEFRQPDAPSYILDVHDATSPGTDEDEEHVGTLQQTDLLVLDYQLDRTRVGDGTMAVRIAREALSNKHFNLILVHTQEDLDEVFYEFVLGFLQPSFSIEPAPDDATINLLTDFEDELASTVTTALYAAARRQLLQAPDKFDRVVRTGAGPWGELAKLLDDKGVERNAWPDAARHVLALFEMSNPSRFADRGLDVLDWEAEGTKFVRAARGFLAFKSKRNSGSLLDAVRSALATWEPLPSRLMLTKLRAEMNERGIEVQDDALGRRDVGAVWYLRLLEQEERTLDSLVDSTARKHAEQLLDQLMPAVALFAKRIRNVDVGRPPGDVIKDRFGLDIENKTALNDAKIGHNAFVGSKPNRSAHLEIGHVLHVDDEYWVCLTPACDMVPKRQRGDSRDRASGLKRFTAVKLLPRTHDKNLRDAQRGGLVFANIEARNGTSTRLSFAVAKRAGESPTSMMMYVTDDGYLPTQSPVVCELGFLSSTKDRADPLDSLELVRVEAHVCGMLRYEYALEIQSHLTASQSRIGLDFEKSDGDGD